jgi:hypothetical protein
LNYSTTTVLFLTLLTFSVGCDVFKETNERVVIAKVKERNLYMEDLEAALPANLTPEDSLNFTNGFIESWATQMLLLDRAELNLSLEEKDVNAQLEEYRRSLIIYQYQSKLLHQLLDTAVTAEQISEYYNNNKDDFELQSNITRAKLIVLDKGSKDVEKVRKWSRSDKEDDREKLEEFCIQHAKQYHLNDEVWVPFDELLAKIPNTSYLNLNYFSVYNYAHVQDTTGHYIIDVKEIKYKNSVSPLEFEKQNIRNILLNQRKLGLVRKLEKDIFNEAINKNEFQILQN